VLTQRIEPLWHDFGEVSHLTIVGDAQSGKSNFLRYLARSLVSRFTPEQVRILLVDYSRHLFEEVPPEYRLGYSVSVESTKDSIADVVRGLTGRLPGPQITPEQLRRRDWWSGPQLFVLVDDFELLVGPDNPLLPLGPFLSHGADIGLHVVLARGAANGMRMSVDPVLRRIQDSNNPEIALSYPPHEGPLLGGTRGRVLPPGRALLCTRRSSQLIQTPWSEPSNHPAGRS
jgi:S-DNA-T family DNA segregation ATPase FtsK/SpoIIIE